MAKKADLLAEAKKLKLNVTDKNTIAQIEAAIKGADKADKNVTATVSADNTEETTAVSDDKPVAKAGKRSDKALKEAEEKAAKEARKETGDTTPADPEAEHQTKKGPTPITRPKLERRGKKYQEMAKKFDASKAYSLDEALKLAAETSPAKFDASVEIHVRLGVDPRQADQNVRATVALPHGSGKTVRVAAFVPVDEIEAAKKAGADIAGEEEIIALLEKEKLDFDILVATPQLMPKLGKYARSLGPRGLMPNPKSGTVATNATKAIKEAKGGRIEYRVDKQSIVHLSIGKVSFGAAKLLDNGKAFFTSLNSVKPTSLKGGYVLSVTTTTTMGPSIKIDQSTL